MATFFSKLPGASRSVHGSAAPRPTGDDPVVAGLCDDMRLRWAGGERVPAEAILDRHPELRQEPELALEIIYEEICLRREAGEADCFADLARRFPHWQKQLEIMRDCHRLLEAPTLAPCFPEVGETVADFHLLKELGRGASGRVFLASQPKLADRAVVVKITVIHGQEHLHLARLQHTHIVPLYAVVDDHARNVRILCMPYFGGITLDRLLESVTDPSGAAVTPRCLAEILRASAIEVTGPNEAIFSQQSYEKGVCWIGLCLAQALQYAHDVGLVHFDIKPSNVLLAADGQPMLLDFHLAQPPLAAGGELPDHVGGTNGYMPPEQELALAAILEGKPISKAVDRRADIYALGAVLYQALGGRLPYRQGSSPPLARLNRRVSLGLSDIVGHCLAAGAGARYETADALTADLRRHVHDEPLVGVRNRSWRERYGKWRRRSPAAGRVLLLLLVVLAAVTTLAVGLFTQRRDHVREAEFALDEGGKTWRLRRHFEEARALLQQGLQNLHRIPWTGKLFDQFEEELRRLEQAEAAAKRVAAMNQLHELAEYVRTLYGTALHPSMRLTELQANCQAFWKDRRTLKQWLNQAGTGEPANAEAAHDLLDVALFTAEVQAQLGLKDGQPAAAAQALAALDEAEELFGPSRVLDYERARRRADLGLAALPPRTDTPPITTAWEHCVLGRTLLQARQLKTASEQLKRAVALEPHGFWPNFHLGLCAYQLGEHDQALVAFSVCIGGSPRVAAAYYNRALCYTARQNPDAALKDYDQALKLDPTLAAAVLNRGILHFQAKRVKEAQKDLRRALNLGANPAAVHCNLAMIHLANHDEVAAIDSLENALRHEANHPQARALLKSLKR